MSQSIKLIHKLQIKVNDIEDEKAELISALEDFVNKAASAVVFVSDVNELSTESFRELSCNLDYVLCTLVEMVSQIQKPYGTTSNMNVNNIVDKANNRVLNEPTKAVAQRDECFASLERQVESIGLGSSELKMQQWEQKGNAQTPRIKYLMHQTEKDPSEGINQMKEQTNYTDSFKVKIHDLEILTETNKCQITSVSHEISALHERYEGLHSRLINLESKVKSLGSQEKAYGSVIYDQRVSSNHSQIRPPVPFIPSFYPPPAQNLRPTLPHEASTTQQYLINNTPQPGIQMQQLPPATQTMVFPAQYNQSNNVTIPGPTNLYTAPIYPVYQPQPTQGFSAYPAMYYNNGWLNPGIPQATVPVRPPLQNNHQIITKKEPESQQILDEVITKEHTEAKQEPNKDILADISNLQGVGHETLIKSGSPRVTDDSPDPTDTAGPCQRHVTPQDEELNPHPAPNQMNAKAVNTTQLLLPSALPQLHHKKSLDLDFKLDPESGTGDKPALNQVAETEQHSLDQTCPERQCRLDGIHNSAKKKVIDKVTYDKSRLLELRYCLAALRKPEGLPDLEIILDKPNICVEQQKISTNPEFPETFFKERIKRKTAQQEKMTKETVTTTDIQD